MRSLTCGDGALDKAPCVLPGTTPTMGFYLGFETNTINLDETHILFSCGKVEIDKTGAEITLTDEGMKCLLSEDETNSFIVPQLNIQLVVAFYNGRIAKSNVMKARVGRVL